MGGGVRERVGPVGNCFKPATAPTERNGTERWDCLAFWTLGGGLLQSGVRLTVFVPPRWNTCSRVR